MTYKFFAFESAAAAHIATERARGRKAYMLRLRAGTFEVRSWK